MVAESIALLAADRENGRDDQAHDLIRKEKEYRSDHHHDEHHGGGDHRLAPRRPGDLLGLGAHLLHELERVEFCHDSCRCPERRGPQPSSMISLYMTFPDQCSLLRLGRRGGTRTPTPRFWSP